MSEQRPKYVQLIESLTARIASKEWKPGTSLPSEASLARTYGVSQGTMRKALGELTSQHLVVREQGRGTFVASHDEARALRHYFRIVSADGVLGLPTSRVVGRSSGPATAAEAARLRLRGGAGVLRFTRLRSFGNATVISERLVLPASRFPNLRGKPMLDLPSLVYEFYSENYGVLVKGAVEHLRAVKPDAVDLEYLGVAPDQPMLEIDRVAVNVHEVPVEWRLTHCDTTHHAYVNRFS